MTATPRDDVAALTAERDRLDARIAAGFDWLYANPDAPDRDERDRAYCAWIDRRNAIEAELRGDAP